MQIETKVDEADIGVVKEGQNVTFRVDAFPDEIFSGKVVQVRIAPKTSDNVVTYTVIIHISNNDLKLKPGMTANVSIETASAKNVLRIPVAALRFNPPEDLLQTVSFDQNIITQKKTLNTGTVWPERGGHLMPPVRVETGVSDNKFVERSSIHMGVGGAYTPTENVAQSPASVIYLGMLMQIWGHCLTDNVKRLWFLQSDAYRHYFKDYPVVYTPMWGGGSTELCTASGAA